MSKTIKRATVATVVGGLFAGSLLLAGGTANAQPSDRPCGAYDVKVTITPAQGTSDKELYAINYTAAGSGVNCKLIGLPTAVTFQSKALGDSDMTLLPDPAANPAEPVNVTASHPATSYLLQDSAAPVTFRADLVTMNLPTTDGEAISLPLNELPLKGDVTWLTPVVAGTPPQAG